MNGDFEQEDRPAPIAGVIFVAAIAVAVSLWLTFGDKTLLSNLGAGLWPEVAGAVAGHATVVVLPTYAVLYFLFYRKSGGGGGAMAVVILAILAINIGGLALLDFGLRGNRAADSAQGKIASAEIDAAKADLMAGRPIDMRIKAKGEMGEMERVSKQMFDTIYLDKLQYKNALAAAGYPDFLAPRQFKSDRGLVATRAKLARVREAFAVYRREMTSLVDDGRAW